MDRMSQTLLLMMSVNYKFWNKYELGVRRGGARYVTI